MKDIYILFLLSILIFFSVQTSTMFCLFSFITYALFLFLSFFFFKVEFLAYLFFIIYMGAIVVLFLFVIMLIEFKPLVCDKLEIAFSKMALVFLSFFIFFISIKNQNLDVNLSLILNKIEIYSSSYDFNSFYDVIDIVEIGLVIYDCFLILLINITMLFALGIISVVILTKEKKEHLNQKQEKKVIAYSKLI